MKLHTNKRQSDSDLGLSTPLRYTYGEILASLALWALVAVSCAMKALMREDPPSRPNASMDHISHLASVEARRPLSFKDALEP